MAATLDRTAFRRVVGRFATGVTVVTTMLPDGERHAMTCNSFTSVSLDPLLVLFCPEKIARFHDAVLTTGTWSVSVLGTRHQAASVHFAHRGRDIATQFDQVPVRPGEQTGAPVLLGALATLECRTVSTLDAGDHSVLLGEVLSAESDPEGGDPLVYLDGGYRTISRS